MSEAILDFDKAIKINPKYAKAYYNRGITKIGLEQKESGCLDLAKAAELGFDVSEMKEKYCK